MQATSHMPSRVKYQSSRRALNLIFILSVSAFSLPLPQTWRAPAGDDEGGDYYPSDDEIAQSRTAEDAEGVVEQLAAAAAMSALHPDDAFELATAPIILPTRVRRRLDRAVKDNATPRASQAAEGPAAVGGGGRSFGDLRDEAAEEGAKKKNRAKKGKKGVATDSATSSSGRPRGGSGSALGAQEAADKLALDNDNDSGSSRGATADAAYT